MKNTEQGEGAEMTADQVNDALAYFRKWEDEEPKRPENAWEDIPGVPPPSGDELDEMARYFGRA